MFDRLIESLSNLGVSGWAIGIIGGMVIAVFLVLRKHL